MINRDINILAFIFERKIRSFAQTSNSLFDEISSQFNIQATKEQWESWLSTNATVLGNLIKSEKWENSANHIRLKIGKKYYLISSDPNFIKNDLYASIPFDVLSISVLKAVPPIKTLWLVIGVANDYNKRPILNKQFAHDAWLDTALHEMFKTDRRRKELFEMFIKDNKNAIDKLRKTFAVNDPLFLGGGSDGAAFDIGNGKVLKLFQDDVAFQKTKEAFDRLHKNPMLAKTEAMIYDVGFLGKYMNFDDVYYSIMEKMSEIPSSEKDRLYSILKFTRDKIVKENETSGKWKKLKTIFKDDPKKANSLNNFVRKESVKIAKEFLEYKDNSFTEKIKAAIPKLKSNWLELYIEEIIMKYITGRVDLHLGNLGITEYGELRYFDPAYADRQSFMI